ncbi:sugar phosphate isomerase/epimerase [Pseudomonas sp. v388]|uniref:sugar phosphate isomerase/epimerase family protein n=1 Tax=Pseudomonas sp. v388 TaxID=2479849 RepID=UPI000F796C2D|nr:sugar phosphate isomerase/epimerase [Pseudomonas sp. v388]RRV10493.1 sugar phosphate isomerase/epimerase [Pseudomonas sp. v388]
MKRLSVAHLTALDLQPKTLAREAGRAGFTHVGLRLHPAMKGGIAYPLRSGTSGMTELLTVLNNEGVGVNDIEFVELAPDVDIASFEWLLESGAELGASSLTVSGDDPDFTRLASNFSALCELATPYGVRINIEFMRWRQVANLQHAAALIEATAKSNAGILVDTLHLFRAGNTSDDLGGLNPAWLADVQLCDAPLTAPAADLIIQEAREGRLLPGDGALPLADLILKLPRDVRYSVETPVKGLSNGERLSRGAASVLQSALSAHLYPG